MIVIGGYAIIIPIERKIVAAVGRFQAQLGSGGVAFGVEVWGWKCGRTQAQGVIESGGHSERRTVNGGVGSRWWFSCLQRVVSSGCWLKN